MSHRRWAESHCQKTVMTGVMEHTEKYPVYLTFTDEEDEVAGREEVLAWNEGGCTSVGFDLLDTMEWLKKHRADLFSDAVTPDRCFVPVADESIELLGVRNYNGGERFPTELALSFDDQPERREVLRLRNDGGFNCVQIDLLDLVAWLKEFRRDLFE